jgi:hypothetical protein
MGVGIGAIGPGISGTGGGGGGGGSVTSFSFNNANGFTGSVTNPTTTPQLTLSAPTTLPPFTTSAVSSSGNSVASTFELVTTAASTITRTLPAPAANVIIGYKKIDSGAGTIVVTQHAAETIDGASTFTVSTQYASIQLISNGTNWFVF